MPPGVQEALEADAEVAGAAETAAEATEDEIDAALAEEGGEPDPEAR